MDTLYSSLAGFAIAFLVTASVTPAVRRFATQRTWHDHPDGTRKLHAVATPSAGGLAIFFGVAVGLAAVAIAAEWFALAVPSLHPVVYIGAAAIVAVGVFDDIRGLGFKPKLLAECVVAYALVHAGYRIDLSAFVDDPVTAALYSLPLTMLWIVGVINAVNLIDGVDGLAAGIAAIAFASLAVVFGMTGNLSSVVVAVVLVGALAGFLIYNFNPASIFMGDSGSLFLGYALAVYALSSPSHADPRLAPLVPAIALGLPLLDTVLSMARRLVERKAIFAPDCDHIHHRMVGRFDVRLAVLGLYVVALFFGAAAVAVSVLPIGRGLLVAVGTFGAAMGLVSMLGYVRRPYVQPAMRLIGEAGPERVEPRMVPEGSAPELPSESGRPRGDGAHWPASLDMADARQATDGTPNFRLRSRSGPGCSPAIP